MIREIKYIVVHCTATKPNMDVGVKEIRQWHKNRGWADIGYHWIIRRDGLLESGRPETKAGAHVKGFNSHSIAVSLVGGINGDMQPEMNYTDAQWETLKRFLKDKTKEYPDAKVQGHRDFPNVAKACPCFDVIPWWSEV